MVLVSVEVGLGGCVSVNELCLGVDVAVGFGVGETVEVGVGVGVEVG